MDELRFSSTDKALQHLADITGARIKVAGFEMTRQEAEQEDREERWDKACKENFKEESEDFFQDEIEKILPKAFEEFKAKAEAMQIPISDIKFEDFVSTQMDGAILDISLKGSILKEDEDKKNNLAKLAPILGQIILKHVPDDFKPFTIIEETYLEGDWITVILGVDQDKYLSWWEEGFEMGDEPYYEPYT